MGLRDHDAGDGAAVVGRIPSRRFGHRIRAGLESKVMRKAAAISTGLHAAVLLWAVISFSGKTFGVTPAESLPVDLINDKDFSELTKGAKDAPKLELPKPPVEKKAEEIKPAEEIAPKLTEKKELKAEKEKSAEPQPKPDLIAGKPQKQDEPKQDAKAEPQPLPPKKPPQTQQPKFDADKIAALLDKRVPQ